MELAKHITDEAEAMIQKNVALPAEIIGAKNFYLAQHDDKSIQAFGAIKHAGVYYKIGPKSSAE